MDFYERAAKLGHSRAQLDAGETVRSTINIPSIDALKAFLDHGHTAPQRESIAKDLFGHLEVGDPVKDGSPNGILTRVHNFLYGNAPLHDSDRARTASLFPMAVQAVSAANVTINTPQVYGPGGTMVYINYGTMTLENGGYFLLYNKPLTFVVDTINRNGGGTSNFYDINIYGSTGASGATGAAVGQGGAGTDGTSGDCASPGIQGSNGGPGGTGSPGPVGNSGGPGGPGTSSQVATITINTAIQGSAPLLTVASRSGTGGQGGRGGTGGKGGTGGHGGGGATCGCEGTNGGNGGPGGPGGTGGTGGNGGNGTDAIANVAVTVPSGQISNVKTFSWPAPPGQGGGQGPGGPGGDGGDKGGGGGASGCPSHSDGSTGGQGGGGNPGAFGNASTVSGTAAKILVKQAG